MSFIWSTANSVPCAQGREQWTLCRQHVDLHMVSSWCALESVRKETKYGGMPGPGLRTAALIQWRLKCLYVWDLKYTWIAPCTTAAVLHPGPWPTTVKNQTIKKSLNEMPVLHMFEDKNVQLAQYCVSPQNTFSVVHAWSPLVYFKYLYMYSFWHS